MRSFGGWTGMWGELDPNQARMRLVGLRPGTLMGWDSQGYRGGLGMVVAVRRLSPEERETYLKDDFEVTVVFSASRSGPRTQTYIASKLNPQSVVPLLDAECEDPRRKLSPVEEAKKKDDATG